MPVPRSSATVAVAPAGGGAQAAVQFGRFCAGGVAGGRLHDLLELLAD